MAKPEIRLKGFEGEWKKKKIGELSDILTGYPFEGSSIKKNGKYLLMRGINITEGYIRHSDDIDRYYDGDINLLTKYILDTNDLVIGMDGSKVGKNSALVTDFEKGSLLVQRVARLRNSSTNVIRLIQIALRSTKFIQYVEENKTSSAIPHISPSDIYNFEISLSEDANEQKWVADYFKSLDSMIQGVTKKIASLKQMKQACLVSLFPQAGETTPRVRFKGFKGEWVIRNMSDLLIERNIQSPKSSEYPLMAFIANKGIVDKGERYDRSALINDAENKLYKKTEKGDFIYSSNNLESGSIGLNNYGSASISPVYSIFYCTDIADSDFIGYRLIRKDFIKEMVKWRQGVMYGQWRIHECDFLKISITAPSYEEQKLIGRFFRSLDTQISLQEQRLEKLKQIKSACLDKMFV